MRFQNKVSFSLAGPVLIFVFIVGAALLMQTTNSFSQVLGCCINNGVNCVGCSTGPCQVPESECQGANQEFTPGASCVDPPPPGQNIAFCEAGPPPLGCCQRSQGDCFETTETTCTLDGFNFLGEGDCLPQFAAECTPPPPTGCCQVEGPMCSDDVTQADCDGTWVAGTSCVGNICGQPAPPIPGCCQDTVDSCRTTTNLDCSAPFFPGGSCEVTGLCNTPPEGCCVLGENSCQIRTPEACGLLGGDYQGDNVSCAVIPECNVVPEGCCVIGTNDCLVTNEDSCDAQGGEYQGDGVACSSVEQCNIVISNVPTIGQWGLIVMAGLLGIFSFIIIIRRKKYGLS